MIRYLWTDNSSPIDNALIPGLHAYTHVDDEAPRGPDELFKKGVERKSWLRKSDAPCKSRHNVYLVFRVQGAIERRQIAAAAEESFPSRKIYLDLQNFLPRVRGLHSLSFSVSL